MGDYSSTFTINNRLAVDLQLANVDITSGYFLRRPNGGLVPAATRSDQFQIKDNFGFVGTEATMDFVGSRNGRPVKFSIYVKCGTGNANEATISSETDNYVVSVAGLNIHVNPMIVEFIIDKAS